MQRKIVGYAQDTSAWYALLECGHRQPARQSTPLIEHAWLASAEERAGHLGQALECTSCERFEWQENFIAYKRTPEFTTTIPAGLLKDHSTKAGVWARIVILAGRLRYRVEAFDASFELTPEQPGVVVPEVLHFIAPLGEVRFFVEFYRQSDATNA